MHGPVNVETSAPAAPVEHTAYVWRMAMVAALGGLLFGYDWVVIGGARQFYELYFHLTSASLIGWANSCALLGCLLGSLLGGWLADALGRKRVLLVAAIVFAVSSVLTGWAHSFAMFILWRIAGGIAIGLSSNVSPLYIAEISPAAMRGRLVSLNQLAIVFGILLAQVANWQIARPVDPHATPAMLLLSWNVQSGWRWMFTVLVLPAMVFFFASLGIPESPRWLLARGRAEEAENVLAKIGGKTYAAAEGASIVHSLRAETAVEGSSWRELFLPGVRRILFVGCALAVLQQWTGINILFNYAAEVYGSAGYGANDILLNIVITGAINLVFTVAAMLLVDRIGRRALMLGGCIGIALAHFACALAYRQHWHGSFVLLLTLGAIACYAVTLAPVTWVLIAEIFPNRVRSQAVSVAVSSLWIASFLLTYTFPILLDRVGTAGAFLIYGAVCAVGFVFVAAMVPETKGRALEEIEASVVGV